MDGRGRKTTPADVFWLSALAKLGATVVTYPLLLVKARLQSAGKHTSHDRRYTGTLDAIERIWKTEGGYQSSFIRTISCNGYLSALSVLAFIIIAYALQWHRSTLVRPSSLICRAIEFGLMKLIQG